MKEQEVKSLLKDLISIKSVSGEEEEIKDYLKQELQEMDVKIYEASGNLIAKLENGGDTALHFNAHMDTVSGEGWENEPLKPKETDGKIYGLGASDLKGGISALMAAIDELQGEDLETDVFLELVTMEEVDGSGTKETLEYMEKEGLLSDYEDQYCVLTEPTGLEKVEIGCKGCLFLEIEVQGESTHGSRPEEGENALVKMKDVIESLENLKEEVKHYGNKELGSPSIAIGTTMEASGSVNALPSSCKITCDIRTTPAIHSKVIQKVKKKLPEDADCSLHSKPTPPSYTEPDSEIVKAVKKESGAEIDTADGADDSPFYQEKGIKTAVIGPGEKSSIHGPEEYIEIEKLMKSVEIYTNIVKNRPPTQSQL